MRIALVNTLYAPYQVGGAERAVQILAEGLRQRGHSVFVLTLGEPGRGGQQTVNGVTVWRLAQHWPYCGFIQNAAARAAWHVRDFHNPGITVRTGHALDEVSPDVVHTNNLAGVSVGIWGEAARRGLPVVHTVHDHYLMCPPSVMYRNGVNCERICTRCALFAAYRRRASRAVGAAVGVSRYILERHLAEGFFPRAATRKVIFNSVGLDARRRDGPRGRPVTFGFMGRIVAGKGVRWLLEAFTRHCPEERLIIAGSGEPRLVEALKGEFPSPSIQFIGHVQPAVLYERVDVLVVPSLWKEAFGRTAIEAMAHGIPVIASNRGGIPEAIQDGVTGLIVDANEPESLGGAMRRFTDEPRLAARLGREGMRSVSRFSEAHALDAYESVYGQFAARDRKLAG